MNKFEKKELDGEFLGHVACLKHGGSDSLALYRQDDNLIDGMCFSECGFISTKELIELGVLDDTGENVLSEFVSSSGGKVFKMTEEIGKRLNQIKNMEVSGWKERRIPKIVCDFYGVKNEFDSEGNLDKQYAPCTQDGEIVGYHVRADAVKRAKNNGEKVSQAPFYALGKVRSDCELFGQSLFNKGGKYIVLCAGEADTMAVFTALNTEQGKFKKYMTPVVCTLVGESAMKQIKNNFEYLNSFQNVIIMYDNDAAGKEGAERVAKLLSVGKAKIAKLSRKDACEHSKRGEFGEILNAFWKAEDYCPAGIVGSSSTLSHLIERASFEKIPLPEFASDMSVMFNGGIALGEITTIAAASSVGKTTVTNEWLYHFIFNSDYRVGVISLESDVGELTENLVSLHINKKLANLPDEEKLRLYESEEFIKKHTELTTIDGNDRYIILDHQGAVTDGKLMDKIEYLVKGLGCKIIILDPLTLAMSGSANEGMDLFMSELLRFVKREKIAHINVVHVRKNQQGSKANSEGASISEEDIKGCLDLHTEVLTPNGWIKISEYEEGSTIYQWSDGELQEVLPESYVVLPCNQGFNHIYNKNSVDMMLSDEHKMLLQNKSGEYFNVLAGDYVNKKTRCYLPVNYGRIEGLNLKDEEIQLLVAIAADGHYHGNGRCKLEVKKDRKKDRIKELLDLNNVIYSVSETKRGTQVYRFDAIRNHKELNLCENWYKASTRELKVLLDESLFWDGTKSKLKGDYFYTSKNEEACVVQHAAHSNGLVSKIGQTIEGYYYVSISKEGSMKSKVGLRSDSIVIDKVPSEDGLKYCFTVPSGYFVARRSGRIFVTGNSGSIFQVSMNNILLMRDKTNEDPIVRNTTKVVVSKNRRCGNTGPAGYWYYDNNTSRLHKGAEPNSESDFTAEFNEFASVGVFKELDTSEEDLYSAKEIDWKIED